MMMIGRIRAGLVTASAGCSLLLLATHRPGPLIATPDDPTAGVVGAAAWAAWALAGYLLAGVVATGAGHLTRRSAGPGRLATLSRRATPRCVRRAVEVAVGTTAAAAIAAAGPVAYADPPRPTTPVTTLDWPGLSAGPVHAARLALPAASPAPTAAAPAAAHGGTAPGSAAVTPLALLSSHPRRHAGPRTELVVRAGDSLWTLAARQLGPGASAAEIAATWPRLYAANRAVIGTDPDLIHPGQRLMPPAADPRSPR